MSLLGFYFVHNLLREAGWPRKQGLFGGESYDPSMVDMATVQMIDWAAAVAAGRPERGLQMIAEIFRDRDWSADDAPKITVFLDEVRDKWGQAGTGPSDDIEHAEFAKNWKSMSVKDFTDARIRNILEQLCLDALLWGLDRPAAFADWYKRKGERHAQMAPLQERAGLQVDAPPPLDQFFADCAEVLNGYEAEVGSLPAIPERLLNDARSVGRIA